MCYGPGIPRQARFFPVVLALLLATPAFAAEKTVAVFDFELIDSSLEGSMIGKNPDEQVRLETMAPALREDIDKLEGYASVDIAPVRDKALAQNLESCGNCALSFAKTLGADIAVTGTVQKVSNLILNINAYAFDVKSGQAIARGSADIRSNTDESWRRGIAYLWKNVLKRQFEAAP
ncbi:MAG TPA: DUF3280 domain-containing protein [Aurantimonas sp.]|uniref:DUF3280 domain-containing protein n=1 Tax=Aurantimonas marianensis TaxID=2920428 RepID=A0A9X2H1M3_9HYPH|nr:DUF3280 domain-containing protein [Aurantimonas marianensis]MCP3053602.1 DUF3280 domain-containing protein [Aurantimonas marianensis]